MSKQLTAFADAYTDYMLPPGLDEALLYNLAVRLCKAFGRPMDPDLRRQAAASIHAFQRGNFTLSDLNQDLALASSSRYGYNIQSGTGG